MDKRYWIAFNHVKGIGAVKFQTLIAYFGNLAEAWHASSQKLLSAGLYPKLVERLVLVRTSLDLDRCMERINKQGISVLTWEDELYPVSLREIDQPPPVLYLRGQITPEDTWAIAVVGTRRVSAYGRQVAEELAAFLGANHITVVSGLARGVDAIAHQGALKAGGRTIAILGCGVNQIYPPEHKGLAEKIMANGAIISDYPPGTPPEASNFPPRNRIISALARATVLVEAPEKSGSLITAQFALDQGREVFAVPGNIFSPQSKGTNRLISQGAHPLLTPHDLLEALDLSHIAVQSQARHALPVDEVEACLLKVLSHEPMHVDEVCDQTSLPIERVSATLTMMELKGLVRQVGGMNFIAVRDEQGDYDTGSVPAYKSEGS